MSRTAVGRAFDYIIGLFVFGFFYWIMDGILPEFSSVAVHDDVYTLAWYLWHGAIVVYLIFGAFWFFNALKVWQIEKRGF